MMEAFYPEHVIGRLDVSEDDYWMGKQLEYRDWTGYRKLKINLKTCLAGFAQA